MRFPFSLTSWWRMWQMLFVGVGIFVLVSAMNPDVARFFYNPPGISAPTSIGPYLNGVFPDKSPNLSSSEDLIIDVAYPQLSFVDPVAMIQVPDFSGFYVAGKPGFIWKISNDTTTTTKKLIFDISHQVHTDGDAGLINFILHPEFGQNGSPNKNYIYMIYRYHPNGDAIGGCNADAYTRLSRFTKLEGLDSIDTDSELVMVQQVDIQCWHTGGGMFFDNEGYFYFTFGDVGGINAEYGGVQQIDASLFGGLHRIDLDMDPTRSHPIRRQPVDQPHGLPENSYTQGYYIPNDNPWVDPSGNTLEEFYALGLRSPHRSSYDPVTEQIWVGDVGQGAREEISIVQRGDNLEWPFREGSIAGPLPEPNPIIGVRKAPIYDYSHTEGQAVIAGFVYRGAKFSSILDGHFIFGDHGSRNIWSFDPATQEVNLIGMIPPSGLGSKNGLSSFATDAAGNIYMLKLYGTDLDGGMIYKLKLGGENSDSPPDLLSLTGAFADLETLEPAAGLIPYDVNSPLWSDRAVKDRWLAIPNDGSFDAPDEQVVFSKNQPWQFPPGTVFVKHFSLPTDNRDSTVLTRLETRFIVVLENQEVYGVTYQWNEAQTDALLLHTGDTTSYLVIQTDNSVVEQVWSFPSRSNCLSCHNSTAGSILGLKTWQLNGNFTYPSSMITDNQLNTWHSLNIFANPFDTLDIPNMLQSVPVHDASHDLMTRVRSYLDANCSHCHQPNIAQGAFDARFSSPLESQDLIAALNQSVNSPDSTLSITPSDPEHSEIYIRDNSLDNMAMPPLAKNVIDTAYISVLTQWINTIEDSSCYITYLSDLIPYDTLNGWGPIEYNQSNGPKGSDDGCTMTINGVTFSKGIGTHANSEINYALDGEYTTFKTFIGVDDNLCYNDNCLNQGEVIFTIELDGVEAYQSPVMTQADDALQVVLDVTGKDTLTLLVDQNGFNTCDHADWAGARLYKPCTEDYFEVALKVYLEGAFSNPFSGEENLMRDELRQYDFIPANSPYSVNVSCNPNIFLTTGPNAVIDWIWVELRDPDNETIILEGMSGLLQRDGDVVATDGVSPLAFTIGAGSYKVLVKHRNHLSVITSNVVQMDDAQVTSINLTDGSTALHGFSPTRSLNGINCLWAGDTNESESVDAGDRSNTWNKRNTIGYENSDCNLNGITDAGDRSVTWNNRNHYSETPN